MGIAFAPGPSSLGTIKAGTRQVVWDSTTATAPAGAAAPATPGILSQTVAGMSSATFSVVGTSSLTGGIIVFECDDGTNTWFPLTVTQFATLQLSSQLTLTNGGTALYQVSIAGLVQIRVRLATAIVGPGQVKITLNVAGLALGNEPIASMQGSDPVGTVPTSNPLMGGTVNAGGVVTRVPSDISGFVLTDSGMGEDVFDDAVSMHAADLLPAAGTIITSGAPTSVTIPLTGGAPSGLGMGGFPSQFRARWAALLITTTGALGQAINAAAIVSTITSGGTLQTKTYTIPGVSIPSGANAQGEIYCPIRFGLYPTTSVTLGFAGAATNGITITVQAVFSDTEQDRGVSPAFTITGTATAVGVVATSVIASQGAGTFLRPLVVSIENESAATAGRVDVTSGSGGAVLARVYSGLNGAGGILAPPRGTLQRAAAATGLFAISSAATSADVTITAEIEPL